MLSPTIEGLRERGYAVAIRHTRRYLPPILPVVYSTVERWNNSLPPEPPISKGDYVLDPCGGETVAEIRKDGLTVAKGYARCADNEVYCKVTGRNKALGRAYRELLRKPRGERRVSSEGSKPTMVIRDELHLHAGNA